MTYQRKSKDYALVNVYNINYIVTLRHQRTPRGHAFSTIQYYRPLSAGRLCPNGNKLKCANYTKGYFCRGRDTIELVTYDGKIVIPQKLQKHIVEWYHTYLLHPGPDITEAIILQHLY